MRKIYVKPSVRTVMLESEAIVSASNFGVEDGPITGPVGSRQSFDLEFGDDFDEGLE